MAGGLPEALAGVAGVSPRAATVLKRTRVTVVRAGELVVKAHEPGTAEAALNARLRAAAALPDLLLPPASDRALRVAGRLVTVWPAGEAVDPAGDPAAAPWEAAAGLLARLHATPAGGLGLPPAGGPDRVARALARLAGAPGAPAAAAAAVRRAARTLPAGGGTGTGLAHGDWHLGQIVRYRDRWLLIDVDDLGLGDPVWDLARPAAWYAAGLLDPELWHRLLSGYVSAGGPAVDAGDPWPELDRPARALTVQLAATAVAAAGEEGRPLDEAEQALVSSCGRITRAARRQ
ncbi:aminoglycoside phosphotransferase [Sphaerisporangium rufum]|uniref:Aminoglycoside phosphotransferase n=1 Tax=Sphaerisporangium rufum TaxID=1381558 RepID=A0A919V101_9ACTN|nr:aminoglycoside phosphotransferase [Sphaerisporangium rufum]